MNYTITNNKDLSLELQSTVSEARSLMGKTQSSSIVLLDNDHFLGVLSSHELENFREDSILKELSHVLKPVFLRENFSLFDWLRISSTAQLELIPIVAENDMTFLGVINSAEVLSSFRDTGLSVEGATVLIIKKSSNEFSYSEIFQIAEANATKVFASYISYSNLEETEIVLNIYHTGLNELLQSFRSYDYEIVSYHEEDLHHETLKANSDYFNKYLTV